MNDATRQAAWQREPGQPLDIGEAPTVEVGENEILVRNHAVAINPLDWLIQDFAMLPWLHYPAIPGSDVAGEVVAIGSAVTRFAIGDRVLGQAVGTTVDQPAQGAFGTHTVVLQHMAAPIPDDMTFIEASVLPLGLGTAAVGLYQQDHLALDPPSLTPVPNGKTLLVWGGSSSVGCNAIQLAIASGYEVFTTASPQNEELVRRLGASQVFDHADPAVVDQLVDALRDRQVVGVFHATGDPAAAFAVIEKTQGRRFVTLTLPPPDERPASVDVNAIFGTSLRDNEVGPMIYVDFLPRALATRAFEAAPPAKVVGRGLGAFQAGVDAQRAGKSGVKLVVDLG